MNEHDATEIAFKNGYEKAAREFIEAVDPMLDLVCHMTGLEITFFGKYGELKKKYTEEQSNG